MDTNICKYFKTFCLMKFEKCVFHIYIVGSDQIMNQMDKVFFDYVGEIPDGHCQLIGLDLAILWNL